MKTTITAAFAIGLTLAATPVLAASDYLLTLDGVPGESSSSIQVESFSWGVSQYGSSISATASGGAVTAPRDAASGLATGRRTHKPVRMASSSDGSAVAGITGGAVAARSPSDLAPIVAQDEIQGFSLTFDKASPVLARVCSGTHIANAQLSGRGETYTIENATFTCSTPKQTQGTTFGERCTTGTCPVSEAVTVVVTGQLKHTKTGHVTLMK